MWNKKEKLLFEQKNGSVYILNSIAGLLTAFQSVIILMILARSSSLMESGIYTLAYASANLFFTIGTYGMRNYQVSDVKRENSFQSYVITRMVSCFAMLVVSIIYSLVNYLCGYYNAQKAGVVLAICIWKMADAFGDVFYGELQKKEKLDLAAVSIICRTVAGIVGFAIVIIMFENLLYASIVGGGISYLVLFVTLKIYKCEFENWRKARCDSKDVLKLFAACTPLLIYTFLSFYLGNVPKYAIDRLMNDEAQAIYGYIAMPVFVVELLNGFILQPVLLKISNDWHIGNINEFIKRINKQIVIIIFMTALSLLMASCFGVPVLSFIYHQNLSIYRNDLLILLAGGGFLAFAGLLVTALTIMRKQRIVSYLYGVSVIIAIFLSNRLVKKYHIMGAAISYLIIIASLGIILYILYQNYLDRKK